jgi:hypothetical protein
MAKKSVKRPGESLKSNVNVTEDAIVITLTDKQKKKARESIRKSGVAKFRIEEIKVKAIPSSVVKVETVQES